MADRAWLWTAGMGENSRKERNNLLGKPVKLRDTGYSAGLWKGEKPQRLRNYMPNQHILGIYRSSKDKYEPSVGLFPSQDRNSQAFRSVPRCSNPRNHTKSLVSIRRPVAMITRVKSPLRAATKLDHLRPVVPHYLPRTTQQSPSLSKDPSVDKFLVRLQSEQILRNGKETERVRTLLKSARRAPSRVKSNPRSLLRIATLRDLSPPANPAEAWTQT